jgi:hypothetical protein
MVTNYEQKKKLIQRFVSMPNDFSWPELIRLLSGFGYQLSGVGKTGGSRVRFIHKMLPPIILHQPHPSTVLKRYQIEQVIELLRLEGLI